MNVYKFVQFYLHGTIKSIQRINKSFYYVQINDLPNTYFIFKDNEIIIKNALMDSIILIDSTNCKKMLIPLNKRGLYPHLTKLRNNRFNDNVGEIIFFCDRIVFLLKKCKNRKDLARFLYLAIYYYGLVI